MLSISAKKSVIFIKNIMKTQNSDLVSNKYLQHMFVNKIYNQFGNQKGKKQGKQEKDVKTKKAKIIQISKQQYGRMKKFIQDIRLSMPMPDFRQPDFPSDKRSVDKKDEVLQVRGQQIKKQGQQQRSKENVQDYFTSEQQKLSFRLLKLSQGSQFGSVLQEFKDSKQYGMKLLILHRFVSVGGTIRKQSKNEVGSNVSKLAYNYMQDILSNMNKLQEYQLEQFLEIYLTMNKQTESKIPQLNVQNIAEDKLPLIANPSHANAKVLVLLIQLWLLGRVGQQHKPNDGVKRGLAKILQHYKLQQTSNAVLSQNKTSIEKDEDNEYELKDLIYIGMVGHMCGLHSYNAIPMAMKQLPNKQKYDSKQVISATQCALQYWHLLPHQTANAAQIKQLHQMLVQSIQRICQSGIQQTNNTDRQQQVLGDVSYRGSGTISALLYSSLLNLQHNMDSNSSRLASELAITIISTINTCIGKQLSIQEYSQYWRSAMIIHKLVKLKHPSFLTHHLYQLVDTVVHRLDIGAATSQATGTDPVIQQLVLDVQAMLFDCLVAYRMVLPPDFTPSGLSAYQYKFANINKQIADQPNKPQTCRPKLVQMINGYRLVCETLFLCGLIDSPQDKIIHNVIICCMVASAYTYKDGTTYAKHYLSPILLQILQQYGAMHPQYGQYVTKLLLKYQPSQ